MEEASSLRVGLCQLPVTHCKDTNHATAKEYLTRARDAGAQLIVLPEIWNSPYATAAFPEYAEVLPVSSSEQEQATISQTTAPSAYLLQQFAKDNQRWIVGGSIPERTDDGKIYNTCLCFDPSGKLVAKHRKVHLFDIDVPGGITFFESDTLSPGETFTSFETPWGRMGVGICYDIRFPEYALLLSDCVCLIYPGAFNMTTGPAHWELLQRARALDNQSFVLTASPARSPEPEEKTSKYPHYTAWGHSTVVGPWGDIVATTDESAGIVVADLDLSKVGQTRASIPTSKQKRRDLYTLKKTES